MRAAVREAAPFFKGKGLTTEAWRLPDGRFVDAPILSTKDVESREFLEGLADPLVADTSAERVQRLEKLLRARASHQGPG